LHLCLYSIRPDTIATCLEKIERYGDRNRSLTWCNHRLREETHAEKPLWISLWNVVWKDLICFSVKWSWFSFLVILYVLHVYIYKQRLRGVTLLVRWLTTVSLTLVCQRTITQVWWKNCLNFDGNEISHMWSLWSEDVLDTPFSSPLIQA